MSTSNVQMDQQIAPNPRSLADVLAGVPGVFALNQDNAAQGLRLSVRGFGTRAAFGVRGLQVNLDGVPLSMPDGQTDLDALDPGLLQSMQVVRGPAASLYGNAAGGVLALRSRPIEAGDWRAATQWQPQAGRSGRLEASTALGDNGGALRGSLAQAHYDGPRQHSHVDYQWQHLGWQREAQHGQWQAAFHGLRADALDPGGLTAAEVAADRHAARQRNIDFASGESIRQQRLSLAWQQHADTAWNNQIRGWLGRRRFDNRLPFEAGGQVQFDRHFAGLSLRSHHDGQWAGQARRISVGLDLQQQKDERQRFDNLSGGQRGALALDQDETARSVGVYSQLAWQLTQRWQLDAGLRHDWLRLKADDHFASDGDDSGRRQLDNWSQSLGLQYQRQQQRWHLRYASGYQTPTINELANPDGGGFNPGLQASRSDSLELGWHWHSSTLALQATVFDLRSKDELQPYELPGQSGRSFYRNVGKTHRLGLELAGRWTLSPHWSADWAASVLRARFDSGANQDEALPGLPQRWLNLGLEYSHTGWTSRLQARAVSKLYADDANQMRIAGYWRVDWQNRLSLAAWGLPQWQVGASIDNLLDAQYNDNVRINAFGGRAFEPAAGTRARLSLNWQSQ